MLNLIKVRLYRNINRYGTENEIQFSVPMAM